MKIKFKVEKKPAGIEELLKLQREGRWQQVTKAVNDLGPTECLRLMVPVKDNAKTMRAKIRQALCHRSIKTGLLIQNGTLLIFKR